MAHPRRTLLGRCVGVAGVLAVVALTLAAAPPAADASLPGRPGRLLFDVDGKLFTINPDGTDKRQVPTTVNVYDPSLSADGSKIVFTSDGPTVASYREIWVMNADGSNPQQRTLNTAPDHSPAWSPDGNQIVFSRNSTAGNFSSLWIMNADGSEQQEIQGTGPSAQFPEFSPDGRQIAFSKGTSLWVVNPDPNGSGLEMLHDKGGFYVARPDWSPDGRQITYDYNGTVWVVNADGTGNRQFVLHTYAHRPAWSPDGKRLAFALDGDIAIARTDGSGSLSMIDLGPEWVGGRLRWQALPLLPALQLVQTGDSTVVAEGGAGDTYTVSLATKPAATVAVTLVTDGQVEVSRSELSFGPETWAFPQTVTVTAVDDGFDEGTSHSATIVHEVASEDPAYAALEDVPLTVSVQDDDPPWQYFALGDGIASGHGLADTGECKRGAGAYPSIVLNALRQERTFELVQLACTGTRAVPQTGDEQPRRLEHQVDRVVHELRGPASSAFVSITVGGSDLGLDDVTESRRLLCDGSEIDFERTVDNTAEAVRAALVSQVGELLKDANTVVALTELYQPVNPSPSWLNDPRVVGGIQTPCDVEAAYDRAEDAVHALNRALMQVRDGVSAGQQHRVRIGFVHALSHGHEGASPGCGAQLVDEAATWVQHPERSYTSDRGGDCYHPNERGARALADAVLSGGDPPVADLAAPTTMLDTREGSILLNVLGNTLRGRSTDQGSGVSTVLATFTPDVGAATTAAARCPRATRLSCSWSVPPPPVPGRYRAKVQAVDRAGNLEPQGATVTVVVV